MIARRFAVLSCAIFFVTAGSAAAATFTVNSVGDGADSSVGDGVCDDGASHCTLRAAIQQANATPGTDMIAFGIGSGVQTISPASSLPTITEPIVIDGTTQPGYAGSPIIELSGSLAGVANGLVINAGSSTVRGLVVNRFIGNGIELVAQGGDVVQGNFIGTDVTGTIDLGNSNDNDGFLPNGGIFIRGAPGNTIGGALPGEGNLISGNNDRGIDISGGGGNVVQGNLIGTDVTGTADVGNCWGIVISFAPGNVIGGTAPAARNVISGNDCSGISIGGGGSNTIQGNLIGTSATGAVALANSFNGVVIGNSPNNTVGGTAPGAGNVISGNRSAGVNLSGGGATTGNTVAGNFIGTDVTGTVALQNRAGVFLGAPGNTIGGSDPAARNVISGNFQGVVLRGSFQFGLVASGNRIEGNFIGPDANGHPLGNSGEGVFIDGNFGPTAANTIGGTEPGAGNVISGNGGFAGLFVVGSDATGNLIQGNLIGTDPTGASALPNAEGVRLGGGGGTPAGTVVGGTTPGAGNVISGNGENGVFLFTSTGNLVQGNLIGTAADGTTPLGNGFAGVRVHFSANDNAIGGAAAGAGNTIAHNGGPGILIEQSLRDAIRGNSIFANGGLGIDLGFDGVTPNDPGDADTGANELQNFPLVISGSSSGGVTTVTGSLNSNPNTAFTLEFFVNDGGCDPSKFGEGERPIGTDTVTTDAGGNASFSFTLAVAVAAPGHITATATDPAGNTSEFSNCGPAADLSITKSDAPDPVSIGASQVLTYTLTVGNGGPSVATGVTVTDTLPASVDFLSASASQGSCSQTGGTVTCNLGSLAVGASATVTIRVHPRLGGTITNSASVSGNEGDPNEANNTATATTEVNGPPQEPPGCDNSKGSPPVCP